MNYTHRAANVRHNENTDSDEEDYTYHDPIWEAVPNCQTNYDWKSSINHHKLYQ